MLDHQRLALREAGNGGVEGGADGHGQQGFVLAATGVAEVVHGFPLLSLFWERCWAAEPVGAPEISTAGHASGQCRKVFIMFTLT
ncbi:hypothetical protein D3C81_1579720 [compost metagenome]